MNFVFSSFKLGFDGATDAQRMMVNLRRLVMM